MSNNRSKVRDAVLWAASFLTTKNVENGRLEAELLMAEAMGKDRAAILAGFPDLLPAAAWNQFFQLVNKRGQGFPLQYLTGRQDFMSLSFSVEEGVLIPRGDTEILVEAVLDLGITPENILDIGTGSGIIAVSLAKYIPNSRITALDVSLRALKLAAKNAEALSVQDRIKFVQEDIFQWEPEEEYDLIISNPPYIPGSEIKSLQKEVQFEPPEALDGGEQGLDFYLRLAELSPTSLKPLGILAVEIGWQQAEEVENIFQAAGLKDIVVVQDYCGRDRVILCRKG